MNNVIITISWSSKYSHETPYSKNLNILKLEDVYKLELAKFMFKVVNNNIPTIYKDKFI